eukprot:Plantae.Rhodophyta-Purpureofilum_apyrenoidigerum.ctg54794.p1 GENE.Plantae.Rhodophyta-Purpureofilum_apyrenoidigerum.ctg54794~~Plantae.Rhodophyta-Purpureofilum_apyrenoidigerum.ctg54794.p1  ORF type:complete len:298 (+),score=50.01 Plantae.Rhodophyta-Purpureofilum_apyrenoidigerum.ctg54794:31-894(+)
MAASVAKIVEIFNSLMSSSDQVSQLGISVLCVSLSGVDQEQIRTEMTSELKSKLPDKCSDIFVVEDSLAPLGFIGGSGLVVLSGTGSVARFVTGEQDTRCGGWGHLVSDGGSAFAIAEDALRHMILAMEGVRQDNGETHEGLWEQCQRHFEVSELPDLLPYLHGEKFSKAFIACFAEKVWSIARGGRDKAAQAVFERAGKDLGDLAIGALRHKKFQEQVTCICAGGVFRGWDMLQSTFLEAVRPYVDGVHIAQSYPCVGAALLALRRGGIELDTTALQMHLSPRINF